MKNKIVGGIAILWGGSMISKWLTASSAVNTDYQAGQGAAAALGLFLVIAGLYYVFFKAPD